MIIFSSQISPDDRIDRGSMRLIDEACHLLRMAYLKSLETNRQATFKIVLEKCETSK